MTSSQYGPYLSGQLHATKILLQSDAIFKSEQIDCKFSGGSDCSLQLDYMK